MAEKSHAEARDVNDVDGTIRLAMDQAFADDRAAMGKLGVQFLQASNFINQQVQLTHTRVGLMYEAKALQNLEEEGIADAVLQNRAAAGQPGNSPSGRDESNMSNMLAAMAMKHASEAVKAGE